MDLLWYLFFLLIKHGEMVVYCVDAISKETHLIVKRQASIQLPTVYYVCGAFPNFVYRTLPCERCRNGGRSLYSQCSSVVECVPQFRGPVECIDGQCCTGNDLDINYPDGFPDGTLPFDSGFDPYNPYNPGNINLPPPSGFPYIVPPTFPFPPNSPSLPPNNPFPFMPFPDNNYRRERIPGSCPFGRLSNIRCSAVGQCTPGRTCLNGICCPWNDENRIVACGGELSIAMCSAGSCPGNLICTPSDYCCACPVGRSGGRCVQGKCPMEGHYCNPNGFCCASCPGNEMPYGTCTYDYRSVGTNYRGMGTVGSAYCPQGYRCMLGDICCKP